MDPISKVEGMLTEHTDLIGAAAFYLGVTSKYASSNTGTSYPFSTQGAADFVAQVAGKSIAAQIFGSKYVGAGSLATQTFNPGAIVNKQLGIAVGLYFLHELFPNKWTRFGAKVGVPLFGGYALGKVFDDPIATSSGSLTGPGQNAYPVANYTTSARNGLPVGMNPPWTT